MRALLEALEGATGRAVPARDHLCLDDWYHRGEDFSFRITGRAS